MKTLSQSVNRELNTIECEVLTNEQQTKLKADVGTLLTVAFFAVAICVAITCYIFGLIPKEFL